MTRVSVLPYSVIVVQNRLLVIWGLVATTWDRCTRGNRGGWLKDCGLNPPTLWQYYHAAPTAEAQSQPNYFGGKGNFWVTKNNFGRLGQLLTLLCIGLSYALHWVCQLEAVKWVLLQMRIIFLCLICYTWTAPLLRMFSGNIFILLHTCNGVLVFLVLVFYIPVYCVCFLC